MAGSGIAVWILGDQLLREHPGLAAAQAVAGSDTVQVVLVESKARMQRRAYQRKKLTLILSALRHYAEELRQFGYEVHVLAAESVTDALRGYVAEHRPHRLITMAAADYEGRRYQAEQLAKAVGVPVEVVPNTQFLTGRHDPFADRTSRPVMEHFYRAMRRHFAVLVDEEGQPAGGSWNYDAENRRPFPKAGLVAAPPVQFAPDRITQQVMAEVQALPSGAGSVEGFDLAVTREQAAAALNDFLENRLDNFGPYEDVMSAEDSLLFHSLLSPYLNIGLLDPLETVRAAEATYRDRGVALNSVEGFVRQILGWREYMYWQYWRQMPGLRTANHWGHVRPMPRLFWDGNTDLACLRHVVTRVIERGYCHHIERLMVICNFCMLAGIDPAQVNEWFLSLYVDAYEWVVMSNVIGMGLNADGGRTATKPYIASAAYINKMSDYCRDCRYDPKARTGEAACPFNYLYWDFLQEHEAALRANPRSGPAVLGLRHLNAAERKRVREEAVGFLATLEPFDYERRE